MEYIKYIRREIKILTIMVDSGKYNNFTLGAYGMLINRRANMRRILANYVV